MEAVKTLKLRIKDQFAGDPRARQVAEWVRPARRKQSKKARLNWRVSNAKAAKYSLGWVPSKAGGAKYKAGQIAVVGHKFGLWDSYGLSWFGMRRWTCRDCGAEHHRDVNAARNIAAREPARLAGGIPVL